MDYIPLSEQTEICGDAFIAETPVWEYDENGVVYEDLPVAFVGTPLLGMMLERCMIDDRLLLSEVRSKFVVGGSLVCYLLNFLQ